jgi:hypothetical protein
MAPLPVSREIRLKLDGAFEQRQNDHTLKVAPGNFCQMTFNDAEATVHSWNEPPTKLLKSLEG